MKKNIACIIFFLIIFIGKGYSTEYKKAPFDTISAKIDSIFSGLVSGEMPGYQIAVTKEGRIIYSRSFGFANLDEGISITTKTIFHVASVSKQFTAFAIWLLAKQGKLNLDDDVRKYLDYFPDFGKKITIRQLINHTSGLRDQWELLMMSGVRLDDVIKQEHIIKILSRQKELNFEPGEEYLYCNSGYTLLAEIVSKVSGMDFCEFTNENIFQPLGMNNSHFHIDHEEIVRNRALSYYKDDSGKYKYSVLSYANVGATSLYTNAEDLCNWINNFFTGVVGGKEEIKQMYERGILNNGDTIDYASGVAVGSYKGYKLIQHSGSDAGFRTQVAWFPEKEIGIVILGNQDNLIPYTIYYNIADILLPQKTGYTSAPKKEIKAYNMSTEELNKFAGTYFESAGRVAEIKTDNGSLMIQINGSPFYNIIPLSEDKFFLKAAGLDINFDVDKNGNVNGLNYVAGKVRNEFMKFEPYKINPGELNEFAGRYYSDELSTFYDIDVSGENVIVKHIRNSDLILSVIAKDVFRGNAEWLSVLKFYRDSNGIIKGFRITGNRARNVLFTKQ